MCIRCPVCRRHTCPALPFGLSPHVQVVVNIDFHSGIIQTFWIQLQVLCQLSLSCMSLIISEHTDTLLVASFGTSGISSHSPSYASFPGLCLSDRQTSDLGNISQSSVNLRYCLVTAFRQPHIRSMASPFRSLYTAGQSSLEAIRPRIHLVTFFHGL